MREKSKSCVTALEYLYYDRWEISNYDLIETIKDWIIKTIKESVGNSQKEIECIQQAMPDIDALAAAFMNEVKLCIAEGGYIIDCIKTVVEKNMPDLKAIINNMQSCLTEPSYHDLIDVLRVVIIRSIEEQLGTTKKVVECIEEDVTLEIEVLAREAAREMITCEVNEGDTMQCDLDGLKNIKVKSEVIIEAVRACVIAYDD